jgi:hypothetical protein
MQSGDSGSVGRVGVSIRGEADTPSHGDGCVWGGGTDVVLGMVDAMVACGVAEADSGERSTSFSSSWS